jgi:hypothetical protein
VVAEAESRLGIVVGTPSPDAVLGLLSGEPELHPDEGWGGRPDAGRGVLPDLPCALQQSADQVLVGDVVGKPLPQKARNVTGDVVLA